MNSRFGFLRPALLVPLVAAVAAAAVAFYTASGWQETAQQELVTRTMSNFFTSLNPVTTLDAVYRDDDGDLVADVPTESALQADPDVLVFAFITSEDETKRRVIP